MTKWQQCAPRVQVYTNDDDHNGEPAAGGERLEWSEGHEGLGRRAVQLLRRLLRMYVHVVLPALCDLGHGEITERDIVLHLVLHPVYAAHDAASRSRRPRNGMRRLYLLSLLPVLRHTAVVPRAQERGTPDPLLLRALLNAPTAPRTPSPHTVCFFTALFPARFSTDRSHAPPFSESFMNSFIQFIYWIISQFSI
jgi:hypothetical protein